MENIIEHEGKKYRVVKDVNLSCMDCYFLSDDGFDACLIHGMETNFPDCINENCHFELVETNQKE